MFATAVYCDHGVVERNRISSLQSHWKALEQECCLPGVFCDSGDTPANLLCQLNGYLMPCTSCLYDKLLLLLLLLLPQVVKIPEVKNYKS